jgi:hypothetical protein
MHRLAAFVTERILPDLNVLEAATLQRNHGIAKVFRSRLVENFLWLHLGTELRAFPSDASLGVFDKFFIPFFESLLSRDERKLASMHENKLYVAHSADSEALLYSFPRFAVILIELAMRGQKDIFSHEPNKFSRPSYLTSPFQTLLGLGSEVIKDPDILEFIYQINFADHETWDRAWESDRLSEVFITSSRIRVSQSPSISAGFIKLWGYVAQVKHFFSNLGDREDLPREDVFKLQQRAREIQSWQINLRSVDNTTRFDRVRLRMSERIERDVDADRIKAKAASLIQDSMDTAFEFWFHAAPMLQPA